MIDLRSDTVTRPTPEMRKAMAEAEVGDDVFGEDPTLNKLQEEVAQLLGKEAALFVPSGTMANQLALKAHTQPGDEVILHPDAHIVRAEGAAGAVLSGVQFRPIGNADGTMDPAEVAANLSLEYNPHFPPTGLICMENTHNFCGGSVVPLENTQKVSEVARGAGIPLHLDGARLLNAAAALDQKPSVLAEPFDSISLCFSKGLGAPVGSVIVGSEAFIHRCHRFRKMFGGGMRQAGILAAAAQYALHNHVERLSEDHANAKRLAEGLVATGAVELVYGPPQTNMLFFESRHPTVNLAQLVEKLAERGVLIGTLYGRVARAVLHLEITKADVETTIQAAQDILAS